jgi:hypothetical protein
MEGQPEFVKKPSGYIIVDGQEVAHTLQCFHCGTHWIPMKGSGRMRGFCHRCNGVLCGADPCMRYHIPKEAQLDLADGGGSDNPAATQKKILDRFPDIRKIIVP